MYERQFGDDLCSKDQRLKYRWTWTRIASGYKSAELKAWTHFQTSESNVGSGWNLEAVQWSDGYEARICYVSDTITSREGFKTRLDAQIGAEKLLREWIEREYKRLCT